ncbi:MAG: stage V sporulation protein AB [Lachnospiraceae bacterium]|nr:stage V sporulation protein AB [Lachnospiraceae bacterium]
MSILMFNLLLILIGLCSGFAVSAGVFALITALSLIPRMADKTHTGSYAQTYETSVFLGAMAGTILYFLEKNDLLLPTHTLTSHPVWNILLLQFPLLFSGLFIGMFVGTLAISLAENLNVTAVFGRRVNLHTGMAYIILSFALGKVFGALLFFSRHWF